MQSAIATYFNLSFALGALVSLFSGLYVLYTNFRSSVNRWWILVTFFGSVWGFAYLIMINTSSLFVASVASRVLHISGVTTLISFLAFALHLTNKFKNYKKPFLYLCALGFLLIAGLVNSGVIIEGVTRNTSDIFSFQPVAGQLFKVFSLYLTLMVLFGLSVMYRSLSEEGERDRDKTKYVFIFSIAGWIGGGSTLLLTHGINVLPYPILLWALYPFFATYAMAKLDLFDTKTATAQLITALLWVFLTVRLILSNSTPDLIINLVVLALIIPAGILLIQGINKEVIARERAQSLANELQEMNKEKSRMLSIASHQFRSPLTSIEGYASMIQEGSYGEVPEYLEEPLGRILNSSRKLAHIVDDFLNISRIEEGRMDYNFQKTDLKEVVQEVVEESHGSINKDKVSLEFVTDESVDYPAEIDIGKFQQVITNLIDNAIKYTQEGDITVRLKRDHSDLLVEVADEGIGIEAGKLDEIFSQFSRADEAQDVNVTGSGLGLYIAKQIIDDHDGAIWATSPGEGKGSTFHVRMSASEASDG